VATILLVEDDDQLRDLLKELLISAGHEVWEAPDGTGVCDLYKKHRFNLVITDLVMPKIEGIELIMELRRIDKNARIVAMSGQNQRESYLRIAGKLGVEQTLSKPFGAQEFLKAVSLALESQSPDGSPVEF
jgi:CheY-like chemotaxis protein